MENERKQKEEIKTKEEDKIWIEKEEIKEKEKKNRKYDAKI